MQVAGEFEGEQHGGQERKGFHCGSPCIVFTARPIMSIKSAASVGFISTQNRTCPISLLPLNARRIAVLASLTETSRFAPSSIVVRIPIGITRSPTVQFQKAAPRTLPAG